MQQSTIFDKFWLEYQATSYTTTVCEGPKDETTVCEGPKDETNRQQTKYAACCMPTMEDFIIGKKSTNQVVIWSIIHNQWQQVQQ